MRTGRPLDIAIVGLACRFPGARDLAAYWENTLSGRDCMGDVPPGRWDPSVFVDPTSTASDRVASQRGGYLDDPIEFDPTRHGIMPLAVAGGEPEQFLVLDAAQAALADAGMPDGVPDGRRVEVVIGRGNYFNRGNLTRLQHGRVLAQTLALLRALHPDWTDQDFEAIRSDLKASLPPFEPATIAGQLTNATAGRVTNRFDLSGASYVVDAASASSLVALDLGSRALVERRADLALVGGVYIACDVDFPMVFSQLGAMTRGDRARPFAKEADGTLPGEGVGVVVLKRLQDAERDDDRVYAVLKGVGLSSDGRGRALASPSAKGHARAIRRAYKWAGIDPATVGFVEGHGLGVPASDRAELLALRAVFPPTRRGRRALGAGASQIGHAMPAAGMAGLIKAALALHQRVIPPAPPVDEPHALLEDDRSPFALNRAARPWVQGDTSHPRRAGVNAFGFAGISGHAVLEEHPRSADGGRPGPQGRWETEAILLGAPDREAWLDRARGLLDWLGRDGNLAVPLKDLAFTLNSASDDGPFRVGLVVSSPVELRERLRGLVGRIADPACRSIRDARGTYHWEQPLAAPGALAFLFPGEGSQYPGMLADLCPHFPEVRALFDTSDRIALEQGKDPLPSDILFGEDGLSGSELWGIGTAVNVVLTAQWALHQLLRGLGLRPDAVVGHSSGEFLALASAGALTVDLELQNGLGRLGGVFEQLEVSGRVPTARLVAAAADAARVERAIREAGADVAIAIDNCPHQVVVGGPPGPVDAVVERLRGEGVFCEPLPFSRAYHTPAFTSVLGPLREFFGALPLRLPRSRVYSCAVGAALPGDVEAIRKAAVDQWALPVAFRPTVEAMHADGVRIFVDVGARGNLAGFVEDTLRGRPHFAIAANLPRRSGLTQLNHLVASLFAQGVTLRTAYLYERRQPVLVSLDRDLPAKRMVPALAVGFPEMNLSRDLLDSLRSRRATPVAEPNPPPLLPTSSEVLSHSLPPCEGESGGVVVGPSTAPCPPIPALPHASGREEGGPPYRGPGSEPGRNGQDRDVSRNGSHAFDAISVSIRPTHEIRLEERSHEPGPTIRPSFREEAMIAHLRTMDAFLETQRAVMEAFRNRGKLPGPATEPIPPAQDLDGRTGLPPQIGPWVGEILELRPGRSLLAVRMLDAEGDPVAEHHTLGGRRVSAIDPSRRGLPVVPFTAMAEMLAQAASALLPDREVVALREVQANRWIRYEDEPIRLEIQADRDPGRPDAVRVRIHNRGTASAPRPGGESPVVEGLVAFAEARPPAPAADPFTLEEPRTCRFTADEIYRDQWLFHGPALQAVIRIGRASHRGIEGTLKVLPRRGLFRPGEAPALKTDPIVLDAFTHLLGCWGLDEFPGGEGDLIFPLRVSALEVLGADPPEGAEVECRIAIRDVGRHRIRADADLVGPDGRVWVRIVGWEDWRFYWPSRYRDQFRQPDRTFVGESLPLPGISDPHSGTLQGVWLEPPADMAKPVWRDVMEWVQLGPEERHSLRSRGFDDRRFTLELWGLVAAKEAARRLWAAAGEAPVYPADLVVELGRDDHPRIRSLLEPARGGMPSLAIDHAEGVAIAVASLDPGLPVGIAVESVNQPPARGEEYPLLERERSLLLTIAREEKTLAEWASRFRCAKKAIAKAAGLGRNAGAGDFEVVDVDPTTGEVAVASAGGGIRFRAVTANRGDHCWSWAIGVRQSTPREIAHAVEAHPRGAR